MANRSAMQNCPASRITTMKTVYICLCTDIIHEGHLNIVNQAHKYGSVIVGVTRH